MAHDFFSIKGRPVEQVEPFPPCAMNHIAFIQFCKFNDSIEALASQLEVFVYCPTDAIATSEIYFRFVHFFIALIPNPVVKLGGFRAMSL